MFPCGLEPSLAVQQWFSLHQMLMETTGFFESHILGKESEAAPGQVRNRLLGEEAGLEEVSPLLWVQSRGFRL